MGKANHLIKDFAQQAREFGEQYGGFFIWTIRETNLDYWPWPGNRKEFKKPWKNTALIFFRPSVRSLSLDEKAFRRLLKTAIDDLDIDQARK